MFLSESIVEECKLHGIELVKLAARCTGIQQPDDLSKCFITTKRLLKSGKYDTDADATMMMYVSDSLALESCYCLTTCSIPCSK